MLRSDNYFHIICVCFLLGVRLNGGSRPIDCIGTEGIGPPKQSLFFHHFIQGSGNSFI